MTTQQTPATEPAPMIHPFPQPGKLVQLAYRELHIAVNGTPDQQEAARQPRPASTPVGTRHLRRPRPATRTVAVAGRRR